MQLVYRGKHYQLNNSGISTVPGVVISHANQGNRVMQLIYRDKHYQLTKSGISIVSGKTISRYQGANLSANHPAAVSPAQPLNLIYRGITYCRG